MDRKLSTVEERLDRAVERLETRLQRIEDKLDAKQSDFEKRLRAVEQKVAVYSAVASLAGGLVGFFAHKLFP